MIKQQLDPKLFFPEVYQAVAVGDHMIHAYMNDGSIRSYDMQPLIDSGGVFEPLRDPVVFRNALTVMNGTAAWDLDGTRDACRVIDIDPMDIFHSEIATEMQR